MAETQLVGIPIDDLEETSQSNLTDATKVIVEDAGTPVTRQCGLGVMADWINDRMKIGGRNLLTSTKDLLSWEITGATTEVDDDGMTMAVFPDQSELTRLSVRAVPNLPYSQVKNKVVTISFLARADEVDTTSGYNGKPAISLGIATFIIGEGTLYTLRSTDVLTEEWKKHSITITITDDIFTTGTGEVSDDCFLSIGFEHCSLKGAQFKAFKMEYGNVATDWSLSDKDLVEATTTKAGLMSAADKTALNKAKNDISDLETHSPDVKYSLGTTISDSDLIIRISSKVINPGGKNYVTLMTIAQMAELLGVEESTLDNARVHVSCFNGDGTANPSHVTSVDWWGGTYKCWYAYLNAASSSSMRFNFMVVYAKPR